MMTAVLYRTTCCKSGLIVYLFLNISCNRRSWMSRSRWNAADGTLQHPQLSWLQLVSSPLAIVHLSATIWKVQYKFSHDTWSW